MVLVEDNVNVELFIDGKKNNLLDLAVKNFDTDIQGMLLALNSIS